MVDGGAFDVNASLRAAFIDPDRDALPVVRPRARRSKNSRAPDPDRDAPVSVVVEVLH